MSEKKETCSSYKKIHFLKPFLNKPDINDLFIIYDLIISSLSNVKE